MMPNFSPNIRGILGGRSEVRTPWRAKQKNHDVSYSIIVKQPRRQQMFLSSCQWKLQPQGPSEVEVLTGPKVHQRSPPVLLGVREHTAGINIQCVIPAKLFKVSVRQTKAMTIARCRQRQLQRQHPNRKCLFRANKLIEQRGKAKGVQNVCTCYQGIKLKLSILK